MDLLFELLIDIIFEGSIEAMNSKNVPIWLRILCTIIVSMILTLSLIASTILLNKVVDLKGIYNKLRKKK